MCTVEVFVFSILNCKYVGFDVCGYVFGSCSMCFLAGFIDLIYWRFQVCVCSCVMEVIVFVIMYSSCVLSLYS